MDKQGLKHRVSFFIRRIITPFFKIIPKQNNLVLFSAWFGEKYIDNTKYLYEYLLDDPSLCVVWITRNPSVYNMLKEKRFPVAKASSLKGIWLQLRANVCFSTVQFYDFNCWLVNNCIFIDLGHGNMIKDPGSIIHNEYAKRIQQHHLSNMHYYAVVPSSYAKHYYKQIVDVDDSHIIISDFARNDVFIDAKLRIGKNSIIESYSQKRRIVYMPTHRSDGKRELCLEKILPVYEINELCERTNSVFIIKKHYYHRNENADFSSYPHIIDISKNDDIDPQVLLFQADILITDYSSCFIDYLLLNRPIIFYQFDYNYYINNERSLFIDFEKENFAPVIKLKEQLVSIIEEVINRGNVDYLENLKNITRLFFDNPVQSGGRKMDSELLKDLIKKYN